MDSRIVVMIVGLILALGMGGLMIAWLDMNTGSGFVGLLFIGGIVTGLILVLAGAFSRSDKD